MKKLIASPLLLFAALVLQCTSLSDVAGRGGSETTNGITVCVYNGDGSSASGKIVRLRPSDYISAPPGAKSDEEFIIDTLTDTLGRLSLFQLPSGSYCIEIKDIPNSSSKSDALLLSFKIGDRDTINFGSDTLHPASTIKGNVDTSGAGAGERYVQVRGLECLEHLSSDGSFELHALPSGDLTMRIITMGEHSFTREISHIITTPGDTSRMELSGTWTIAKRIYFNTTDAGTGIKTNQYNFPALLRLDSTSFNFSTALSHGEDIRFSKENGTAVPFEIEEWSQSKCKGTLWVLVDTIYANSSSQFLLMSWGEQGASSISDGAKVFDTARGYVGVWHLDETATGAAGELHDATSNHLNGQAGGGALNSLPVCTPGLCGIAQEFNGNSSYVRIPDAPALHIDSSFTVSFWVYYRKKSSANARFISKDGDWSIKENESRPQFTLEDSAYIVADTVLSRNAWHFITVVTKNLTGTAEAAIYVDGKVMGTYENTFPTYVPGTRVQNDYLYFGQQGNGEFFLDGILDEIRILRKPLTADEIKLMYENQKPEDKLAFPDPKGVL